MTDKPAQADATKRRRRHVFTCDACGHTETKECAYCVSLAALEQEQQRADRLYQDRYNLLNLKTTEGYSAAEWQMRTANAVARAEQAEARLKEAVGLLDQIPVPDLECISGRLAEAVAAFIDREGGA